MKRSAVLLAALLMLALPGCSDATDDKIAAYDPTELQMLRDQAEAAGFEDDDEVLLQILEFRQLCREMGSSLDDLAAGEAPDKVADDLQKVLVDPYVEVDPVSAEAYQKMVDEVRLGSSENLQVYRTNSCPNVP